MEEISTKVHLIGKDVDKLLKQQHEAVLWNTKGKDQKVKDTLSIKFRDEDFPDQPEDS